MSWLSFESISNKFKQTYLKGFLDVSGDLTVREGDVSMNQRLYVHGDVSMNQRLEINGDVSINEVSKLFNNKTKAVIVNYGKDERHIITVQDMIDAIK